MTQSSKHIEIGKLTADEAERFAASFKPVWELDDAPFAQASKLSAAEMDALAGGAGIDVEIEAESKIITSSAPRIPPPARHERHEDKVLVADAIPQPVPAPAPVAQPARRSSRPPAARNTVRMAAQRPTVPDDDFAPIKKSNTGLFVGIGAVVLIISGIAIAKVAMKTEPTASTTKSGATAQQPPEQHEPRIPPPPPVVETDDKPAQVAKTAPPPQPTAQPTETATQAAPTQTQAAAIVKPQTTATQAPTATTAAAAGTTKPGGGTKPSNKGSTGGIVRETPF